MQWIWPGGKNGHKKYHKKGSKTTGFHHKGHKDDFHKEHKFYDSEEKKGDHKKYGSEHEFHESKKGEHKKGEKHDSGYDEGHKGKPMLIHFWLKIKRDFGIDYSINFTRSIKIVYGVILF